MKKTVTLDEVRDRLPELIRDHLPGTKLRVTDGETAVAELTVTRPPTAEEEAADQARFDRAFRDFWALNPAHPPIPEGVPLDEWIADRLADYRRGSR
ncbi:MAG: hypothetical protein U0871_13900 [Gemmataceae bacterium]